MIKEYGTLVNFYETQSICLKLAGKTPSRTLGPGAYQESTQ